MKRLIRLAVAGSAGLVAGAALAGAPGTNQNFGQYTVTAGVPSGCVQGAVCTTLVPSSNGFMQQRVDVTAGVGSGSSYIRTVIVDNGVSIPGTFTDNVGGHLNFQDETFVGASSNSGNLAAQGNVNLTTVNSPGAGYVKSTLARGNLAVTGTIDDVRSGAADATGIRIQEVLGTQYYGGTTTDAGGNPVLVGQLAGSGDPNARFDFGTFAGTTLSPHLSFTFDFASMADGSSYMKMNEFGGSGTTFNGVTARRSSGNFTAGSGTLTLPDGSTVGYSAGDDIAVTLLQNPVFGIYPAGNTAAPFQTGGHGTANGYMQVQHITNYTSGESAEWVNDDSSPSPTDPTEPTYNNAGMAGLTALVSFTPVDVVTYTGTAPTYYNGTTGISTNWAYWDTNFGTAPRALIKIVNATTGVQGLIQSTLYSVAFP